MAAVSSSISLASLASGGRRSVSSYCFISYLPLTFEASTAARCSTASPALFTQAAFRSYSSATPSNFSPGPATSTLEDVRGGRSLPLGATSSSLASPGRLAAGRREATQQQITSQEQQFEDDNLFTARRQGYGSIANAFDLHSVKGHEGHGLWTTVKQAARFYWKGIRSVYANNRYAATVRRKSPLQWSRAEFNLVHRADKDKRRVYPFVLLAIIAPEAIPFVLLFAPGMVPSTCVKPDHEAGRRLKLFANRQKTASAMHQLANELQVIDPKDFRNHEKALGLATKFEKDFDIQLLDELQLSSYCKFLGLASWGPESILRVRLRKHLDYLREEDKYIAVEGIERLPIADLERACEDRGISTFKVDAEHLRSELSRWLRLSTARRSDTVLKGLAPDCSMTVSSLSVGAAAVQSPMLVFIQMFMHDKIA